MITKGTQLVRKCPGNPSNSGDTSLDQREVTETTWDGCCWLVDVNQRVLTVDRPSRVGVPVCGVSDAPAAQLVRLLHRHVLPVAAVHHAVGVAAPTAGGEHAAGQTRPSVVHVVQTGTLETQRHPMVCWEISISDTAAVPESRNTSC